jgi:hypothetical protein
MLDRESVTPAVPPAPSRCLPQSSAVSGVDGSNTLTRQPSPIDGVLSVGTSNQGPEGITTMTRFARVTTAVLAIGAALTSVSTAAPATAKPRLDHCDSFCWIGWEVTLPHYRYEAQADNKNTPSGSWIRVWGKGKQARADYYQEGDPQMRQIYSPKNGGSSKELTGRVAKFRVCGPNVVGIDGCSRWWAPKPWRL